MFFCFLTCFFHFRLSVNNLLSRNISILIGPMETSAVIATQPLCKTARVPQIAPLTSLETVLSDDDEPGYLLRMNPTEKLKSKVLADIVKYFHWQTMAVLGYQDREGIVAIRENRDWCLKLCYLIKTINFLFL